jgi:hypothetical protein
MTSSPARSSAITAKYVTLWSRVKALGDCGRFGVTRSVQSHCGRGGLLDYEQAVRLATAGAAGTVFRGRHDPQHLRAAELLDWWRVEEIDRDHRLLLRAEMRMPGTAWLECGVGTGLSGGTEYRQDVTFVSTGLAGHLSWWGWRATSLGGCSDRCTTSSSV